MVSIWSEGGLALYPTSTVNPLNISELLNNGCLLKTVNLGGERGAFGPTPLSSFTPKEDSNK